MEPYKEGPLDTWLSAITNDFCGKIKISAERIEWSRLLKSKEEVFSLLGNESGFLTFCRKFIESCSSSGNFLVLIEQTVSRLRQVRANISKRTRSSPALIEQCCAALHLCTLLFNYIFSTQTQPLFRKICGIHQDWPSHSSENDSLLKSLIDEVISAINCHTQM